MRALPFKLPSPLTLLFTMVVLGTCLLLGFAQQRNIMGWQLLNVKSGSMAPAIPTGSIVISQAQSSYQVSDIVTYQHPTTPTLLITHRIVGRDSSHSQTLYTLKGDANSSADLTQIPNSQIVGKVAFFVPLLGYVISFLQTPIGVMFFIVVPGTILVYEEFRSIQKNIRSMVQPTTILLLAISLSSVAFLPSNTWSAYATTSSIDSLGFSTRRWLEPSASYSRSENDLVIETTQVRGITGIEYKVLYTHRGTGEEIPELIQGTFSKNNEEETASLPHLYLGTCSAEEVCTAHTEVSNLQIELIFKSGEDVVHTTTSSFGW